MYRDQTYLAVTCPLQSGGSWIAEWEYKEVYKIIDPETGEESEETVYYTLPAEIGEGILFCGECGMPLTRRTIKYHGKMQKVWKCKGRIKDCKSCQNDVISEEDLFKMLSAKIGIKWRDADSVTEDTFSGIRRVTLFGDGHIEIEMEEDCRKIG